MPPTSSFRYRFFIIGACFWLPFYLYSFDKVNTGYAIAQWIARHAPVSAGAAARFVFSVSAVFGILAATIRTWASAYLHSDVVHDMALHSEKLVADGPYQHVRNPLYLGNILLALGMGLMANRAGFFVMVLGNLFFAYRLIGREEAQLFESQGESYRRFLQTVPRLLPSLTPRVPASGATPRWPQAFFGETFFWAFAAATVVFAFTSNLKYWFILVSAALPLYGISVFWLKRRNRASSTHASD